MSEVQPTRDRFGGRRAFWTCPICEGPATVFRNARVVFGIKPWVMTAHRINGARCDACELEQLTPASVEDCERAVAELIRCADPAGREVNMTDREGTPKRARASPFVTPAAADRTTIEDDPMPW